MQTDLMTLHSKHHISSHLHHHLCKCASKVEYHLLGKNELVNILTTSNAGSVIITVVNKLLHKPKMSARLAPSGSLV